MQSLRLPFPAIWLTALSLSIGWGIRGNFGHEFGAMIPGALAAMGAVLLSGREDWRKRIAYFAMFGALGWSWAIQNPSGDFSALIKKTVAAGVIAMGISVAADWGIVRAIYGDAFAGFAGKHIRFGPGATATTEKPKEGQPHP